MMKKKLFFFIALAMTVFAVNFLQSCSKDKDDEPDSVTEESLSLGATDLFFNSEKGISQSVSIFCNGLWTVSCEETWVDISPKNGNGDGMITITVNSANNTAENRTAVITVTCGELKEEISIEQKASLAPNCQVTLNDIVTLGNQFAFNVKYGENVAYFQWKTFTENDAKRLTEEEIVSILEERERIVEEDDYFHYVVTMDGENYLSPNTNYLVYTIAHDNKGNRGELVKTTVKTRGLSNQPAANVEDIEWTGSRWEWHTEINPYASRYYQANFSYEDLDNSLIFDEDIISAYYLYYLIKTYPSDYPPAIQSGYWQATPARLPYIYVVTWAQDREGEWSGVIDSDWMSSNWFSDRPTNRSNEKAKKEGRGQLENKSIRFSDLRVKLSPAHKLF